MSESMPDRNVASSDAADVVIDTATLRPDEKQFLEEHSLKKPMGTAQIWALGVGAVITGEYFGWNGGLGVAGPTGMLIASLFVCVLYMAWCWRCRSCPSRCRLPAGRWRTVAERSGRGSGS